MHLKFLATFYALVTICPCLASSPYRTCANVDFCSTLRGRTPSNVYTASLIGTTNSNNLNLALTPSDGGPDLTVVVTGLQQQTFRVKITEVDSSRYELEGVLDGEPEYWDFNNVTLDDDSVTVTTVYGSNVAKVYYSPFRIEFSKNGHLEVVLEGDRLTMSQNTVTAPFSLGITFPEAIQLYGIHEHCETLALPSTAGTDPFRLKNSDLSAYPMNSTVALYGAVPVVYGLSPSSTSGVFLHNAAEQWIDITNNQDGGSQAYFMAEMGALDLFVFLGPTPSDVVRQYTSLTGTTPLPQFWSLGYHQSRYSYETQEDVEFVINSFDSNDFQLDAIWLDIDYTDGFKYFTWNPSTFSDPVGLQNTIASTGKHLVTIIDPHVKVEEGYSVYDQALANDFFVKNQDGSMYQGQCWPGLSGWIDFLNPDARDFYAGMYSYDQFINSTPALGGIWNDMNEPSVFDTSTENTLPADSLHVGNVRHREIHNMYGFLHTMATHQGLVQRDNGEKRPFILSRSTFAGSQRYAAFWTGDNEADWSYLHAAFQECLNANLQGIVFCGGDVGGFMNNPDGELIERWYQAGAWLPFYRAHSNKDTQRREPYLWPEDTQVIIRNALQTRYKHLPVWYTLFYEHYVTGDAIIRPLFYHYAREVDVYGIDDEILIGTDILVKAVVDPGVESLDVYFPGGRNEIWVSANGDDVQPGNGIVNVPAPRDYIPVYYRRGAIILRKEVVRPNTAAMAEDPYSLYYTPSEGDTAFATAYVDDGTSFNYRDNSDFTYYIILVAGEALVFVPINGDGDYEITLDKIVRRDIVQMPENGKSGIHKETVYTTDANGTPLKDIRIGSKEKMVLKLK